MTPRDTWRVPVSWLVTCDNHRSHLRTITRRISPHHSPDDPRIVSTLVSLASLHYYPGPLVSLAFCLHYYPGSRVSDDELLAAICLTWAIVTGLCLGIMSSARTKTQILRRERAEIHRPMEWVSQLVWVWQLLPSYNADTGMNICPSLFIILICAVLGQNPPSCESGPLWARTIGDVQLLSPLINNLLDLN